MIVDSALADEASWSSEHLRRNAFVAAKIEPSRKSKILEVGCGSGAFTIALRKRLPTATILGVDAVSSLVARARENAARIVGDNRGLSFECMDGRALKLDPDQFDFVCSSRLLLHARRPEELVLEMARVARPGAELLFVEPTGGRIAGVDYQLYENSFGFRNPSVGVHLPDLLTSTGFANVQSLEHSSGLLETMSVHAFEREFEEGRGFQALACRRGRVQAEDVQELIRQLHMAASGGQIRRVSNHNIVTAVVGAKIEAPGL